jgi:beta-glucosidase
MGYRGFERNKTEPLYPFGYGLSYTTFEYGNLKIEKKGSNVLLNFSVRNSGKREGKAVAQVYVSDKQCSVERPVKELKAFKKVSLRPGESTNISIELKQDAFAFYDIISKAWKVEPGDFEILVGASSTDIRLRGSINITGG